MSEMDATQLLAFLGGKVLKQYWLFAGTTGRLAGGGMKDFVGAFATRDEVSAKGLEGLDNNCNWWHVINIVTGEIVDRSSYQSPIDEEFIKDQLR